MSEESKANGTSQLERFVMLLKAWRHRKKWEYGTFRNGQIARRNRKKRNVQFILWMPGEQGYKKPYWYNADSSWWTTFKTKA